MSDRDEPRSARCQHVVVERDDRDAGGWYIRVIKSAAGIPARPGVGKPRGVADDIDSVAVQGQYATAPAATRTAINGPGNLGARRAKTSNTRRTDAAKATVGQ